jgi:tetratricopeptide (TPR) repeat protein
MNIPAHQLILMLPSASSDSHASATSWRLELQESVAEIAERAMVDELARHVRDPSYYPRIDYLAVLLQRVAQHLRDVDRAPIAEFLKVALDAAVTAGPGRAFEMTNDFLDAAEIIIDLLAARDQPVTDLLLAKARYLALLDNTGQPRANSINRAIDASKSAGEHARALLMLAEYNIDSSRYRKARRVAEACEKKLADSSLEHAYYAEIQTITGLSYFFINIKKSERYFTAAIDCGESLHEHPEVRSAVSTAYHYLGRIQAARREFEEALESYVTGERLSDHRLAGTGWYHLRMGEVLLECGHHNEAYYHLREAQRIFELGQVISSGDVVLNATWSRYYVWTGDLESAERLLVEGMRSARAGRYPRGELICIAQLIPLELGRRRYLSCFSMLIRGCWVFGLSEAESGLRTLPSQLQTLVIFARRLLSSRPSKEIAHDLPVISCPCADDHTDQHPR